MKTLHYLRASLALALGIVLFGWMPAHAADAASSDVVVPWGAWMSSALSSLASFAVAVLSVAVAKWAPIYVKMVVTNDLIAKAVNFGIASVEGAVAGRELDVKTANVVIAAATNYAVQSEPQLAAWVGANIMPLILAKLSELGALPADASAANTGVSVATSK
jgi:hypothetical protein